MSKTPKPKTIRPLDGFSKVTDAVVVARGTAVQTGMTANANFPNPPADLKELKAAIDRFSALIAEALDGSKKVVAQKNKQRRVVIQMLRLLGRYVEVNCRDDMAIFNTSGFEAASSGQPQSQPLSQNIRSIRHGTTGGQLIVLLRAVPKAGVYELRYAGVANGAPGNWTTESMTSARSVLLKGLTPGTTYAFQVRSLSKAGQSNWSNWSDPVTYMCM